MSNLSAKFADKGNASRKHGQHKLTLVVQVLAVEQCAPADKQANQRGARKTVTTRPTPWRLPLVVPVQPVLRCAAVLRHAGELAHDRRQTRTLTSAACCDRPRALRAVAHQLTLRNT
eukprot:TRINITY_DN23727_c0_g1_i1.p1 TRINITY_DN23727_c0_g1~~TRINITY_DN23727_c0_g1_i1.p1  ORF type:complete len:117 (-),score=0.62 TRINITY_DN23727_c0_g1_i1:118-468(-)